MSSFSPKQPLDRLGAAIGRRSGIKEEAEGRGTAAEPSNCSAEAIIYHLSAKPQNK